jgi:hypothetical protein
MDEWRFDVFGTLIAVVATTAGWETYLLGTEGKRRPAGFVVPDFVTADELAQFLADLFHESATPTNGEVRRLG